MCAAIDQEGDEVSKDRSDIKVGISAGTSFGSALAMAISYNLNQHIGWAILHGILSWFYVIYAAIVL